MAQVNQSAKNDKISHFSKLSLDELLRLLQQEPENIEAVIQLAIHYNSSLQHEKLLDTLHTIEHLAPFADQNLQLQYEKLSLFALIRLNRLLDAETIGLKAYENNRLDPDLLYCLTFIKTSLREYEEAIKFATNYIDVLEDVVINISSYEMVSSQHRSQLLNFLGTAYKETGNFPLAILAYENAIELDKENHLPYINLAGFFAKEKKLKTAQTIISRGIKNCTQVQELRMLLEGYQKKTTISACMIVKNEEELLPGCLESIRDWVDEIIIVDTGSTDKTIEISKSYGAKIYNQAWEGNFSKARNYSLEQATSDWIFIIDADERIYTNDIPHIIRFLNDNNNNLISINVINVYGENEDETTFLPSERFFRRELNLRYKGIVHNQLDVPSNVSALRTPIRMKHYGYGLSPEKMKQKLARSKALLEKQLEDNPNNAFARFNLAQILRAGENGFPIENADQIIHHAEKGVELTNPENNKEFHIHLMCLDQLAWTYFYKEEYDKAEKYAQTAINYKNNYLDPLLLMGHIYARQGKFTEAIEFYKNYLKVQSSYDRTRELSNIIFFHVDSVAAATYSMAVCYLSLNEHDQAREFFKRTSKVSKAYLDANVYLGKMYLAQNLLKQAKESFQTQLEFGKEKYDAALGLAAIALEEGDYGKAKDFYLLVLKENENDNFVLERLIQICEKLGQTDEMYEYQARLNPSFEEDAINRKTAERLFSESKFEEALEQYELIITQTPDNAELYNDLGNCYFRLSNFNEAVKNYQKATDLKPSLAIAWRNLGLAQIKLDKIELAIDSLQAYLSVNGYETATYQLLGDLYKKTNDLEKAIYCYESLLRAKPEDVLALFSLSNCYLLMGHKDSAILGYRKVLQIDPHFKPALEKLDNLNQDMIKA